MALERDADLEVRVSSTLIVALPATVAGLIVALAATVMITYNVAVGIALGLLLFAFWWMGLSRQLHTRAITREREAERVRLQTPMRPSAPPRPSPGGGNSAQHGGHIGPEGVPTTIPRNPFTGA